MAADAQTIGRAVARAEGAPDHGGGRRSIACLHRIAERNPSINAFITVLDDDARAQAREPPTARSRPAATAARCTAFRSR